jgi:FtsH-binding integral membrane protein
MDEIVPTVSTPVASVEVARSVLLAKVLGLVGFAFVFTAGGAAVGAAWGPEALPLSLVGSLGTLIALMVWRERRPLNLGLMYAFATFEGLALGVVLERYVARGLGGAILEAAAATAAVTLLAGGYGYRTKRDLTGLGSALAIGLVALLLTMVAGVLLQVPALLTVISMAGALLFTGYIVYDLNKVANTPKVTEGEAILLAVNIYLDLLNLFLFLLSLLGGDDN